MRTDEFDSGRGAFVGLSDALVVDIGGTTTDIGVLVQGFPRQSSAAVDIGGIRTNFRMPDILSIGLGGGTIVRLDDAGGVTVGPDSVGYKLTTRARIFGGDTLTTTDVAVKLGRAEWPGTNADAVDEAVCGKVDAVMQQILEDAIDRMKTSADPVDVILVGGGSLLVPDTLAGASRIIRPDNYDAANAIGAALGEVSGESGGSIRWTTGAMTRLSAMRRKAP